ncbi:MAG: ABC transporter substrate-binding protein [Corynebacterium sp.]|uniref:ABC transporter substrate-binding protein n=1 Tax=Corynebacterium sp. TaxID=1720 RepID=UPI0026DC8FD5|nr:ABC transporter substrate-binding protein [Corynebacterium sp.]MDO5029370.1 ABC transporter substrate-binding protein [Corynebacterium sp.]
MKSNALRRLLRHAAAATTVAALTVGATACTDQDDPQASSTSITLTNCGEEVNYAGTAQKLLINDSNLVSMALAVGAADQIAAVSSVNTQMPVLEAAYGDAITKISEISKEYPSLEQVIAAEPDVMLAGWGYGFSEDRGITPESLREYQIGAYTLTESCRTGASNANAKTDSGDPEHIRGVVNPWEAVRIDVANIAKLTGHEENGRQVVSDIDARLKKLDQAPKENRKPVGLVFDSAADAPLTSGAFGAPQGILDKAGATHATESIKDTWTTTSWEHVAETEPDFIALVEYPGQSFEEKIRTLRTNPATKDLRAVKEERFINLPYVMWTESPLNVDAAEHVRKALEKFGLQPESEITTSMNLPADLPGREYFH